MPNFVARRSILAALAATGVAGIAANSAAGATPTLAIDASRLRRSLEDLSVFGRPVGGTFADGVNRFAYSDADIGGRNFAMGLIRSAGSEPRIDAAGNIVAVRAGQEAGLKPILIGSHIDSVPSGGNFDGALGSMAAIEVLRTLHDQGVRLRHPLEIVLWSNEEGGTIGSGLAAGTIGPEALELTLNGLRRRDGLRRIGGDPDHLKDALIVKGSVHTYLELHIEQSGLLEKAGVAIGVVDGIVAINEYEVEVRGFANHAGTTPMPDRRNALLAAAELVQAVQEEVTREPGRQVGTVGHLEVFPNARNVVPGRVRLTIELRDLNGAKINSIGDRIVNRANRVASDTHTEIDIKLVEPDEAALATPAIQREIEAAAKSLGLSSMHLPSGAGHDAQIIAKLGPMGMIFVPSVAGISHSPRELTSWQDCANGANVLLQTLARVDRQNALT
jgi:N-carbamoyl-L-amino-acid hydrolase